MNNIQVNRIEDSLWHASLNLHNRTYEEQLEFLHFLKDYKEDIGNWLFFKTLVNMLHVYYSYTNNEFTKLYVELFLSIDRMDRNDLNVGDVIETLGLVIKGCDMDQIKAIQQYIQKYVHTCKQSPSSMISACNCYRYIYPEVSEKEQKSILDTLYQLKADNTFESVDATLYFTIKSLQEDGI